MPVPAAQDQIFGISRYPPLPWGRAGVRGMYIRGAEKNNHCDFIHRQRCRVSLILSGLNEDTPNVRRLLSKFEYVPGLGPGAVATATPGLTRYPARRPALDIFNSCFAKQLK